MKALVVRLAVDGFGFPEEFHVGMNLINEEKRRGTGQIEIEQDLGAFSASGCQPEEFRKQGGAALDGI